MQERLKHSKIVTLEIELTQAENYWENVVSMYKNNPLFDEVLADIEAERAFIRLKNGRKNIINNSTSKGEPKCYTTYK